MIVRPCLSRPTAASVACWLALGLVACSGESASLATGEDLPRAGSALFTRLPSGATGVRFQNRLEPTAEFNVFTYRNYYNGGGVAIGDLTGEGLPEIVLTSNVDGPRVYRNDGRFSFRDVTDRSGLERAKGSWTTGVALADVNADGRLDLDKVRNIVFVLDRGAEKPGTVGTIWIDDVGLY